MRDGDEFTLTRDSRDRARYVAWLRFRQAHGIGAARVSGGDPVPEGPVPSPAPGVPPSTRLPSPPPSPSAPPGDRILPGVPLMPENPTRVEGAVIPPPVQGPKIPPVPMPLVRNRAPWFNPPVPGDVSEPLNT